MRQKGFTPIIVLLVVVAVLVGVGYLAYMRGYVSFNLPKPSVSAIPSAIPSPSEIPDLTANWKTYTNTVGYTIKYPPLFTTQLIAAGAGNVEATSLARNLFIYKVGSTEPYVDRYISLELFQIKPTYNQGTVTEVKLGNLVVEKIVITGAKFDIYSAQLSDNEYIEIYVSNDASKKEIANQILATFKLTQ